MTSDNNDIAKASAGKLIDELRQGVTALLLATESHRLTLGNLAAEALLHALGAAAKVVRGNPELSFDKIPGEEFFLEQATGWNHAADIFELLLELEAERKFTHIVCLDRWSAELLTKPRRIGSDARWILLDNFKEARFTDPADSQGETEVWIKNKGFDAVIPARELLDFHPALNKREVCEASTELRNRLIGAVSAKQIVIIDESSDAPADPHLLDKIAASCPRQAVLLTPHLKAYRRDNADLLAKFSDSFDTAALALPVYRAILQSADVYLAPHELPFGKLSRQALRQDAIMRIRIAETALPAVTDAAQSVPNAPDKNAPAQRARNSAPSAQVSHNTFENWWQQHGTLSGGEKSKIEFSVLTCCYKYLQRFRIFLDSLARQEYPRARMEICIALPGNPDGALEYLELFQSAHPGLAVRVKTADEELRRNRGALINAAFSVSRGKTVMVADGDIVLPSNFVAAQLQAMDENTVSGCWRTALSSEITAQIVTGNLDAVANHAALSTQWDESQRADLRQGVLGYCQVLSRRAFQEITYPEEFNCINQSDIVFVERLQAKLGIRPRLLEKLFVLHLHHQRNWNGTEVFL